jgi:hypothetical protein
MAQDDAATQAQESVDQGWDQDSMVGQADEADVEDQSAVG